MPFSYLKRRLYLLVISLGTISSGFADHFEEQQRLSTDDCSKRGFTANLLCSSCKELAQFNLHALESDCLLCCSKDELDEDSATKRYPMAELEVCTCKFGRYPQIQAFCTSDKPKQWPNLRIRYLRAAEPVMKLMNADGDIEETFSIQKWDTDTISEFLNERLEKPQSDVL